MCSAGLAKGGIFGYIGRLVTKVLVCPSPQRGDLHVDGYL